MTFRGAGPRRHQGCRLAAGSGFVKGDRIAVMMPNLLQNPVIVYGILKAGMVVVNINRCTRRESCAISCRIPARLPFLCWRILPTRSKRWRRETKLRTIVVTSMGDMLGLKGHLVNFIVRKVKKLVPTWSLPQAKRFRSVMAHDNSASFKPASVQLKDIAFLQYTGGTTGVSKGRAHQRQSDCQHHADDDLAGGRVR